MSLPRDAVAWSVIVTFSCASHVPLDQVSASGPLVVFCVAVIVIRLFLAVPWLVCDWAFSHAFYAPWDQVSPSGPLVVFCCRVAVFYVSSSRCRCMVCDFDILRTSHAPWDQVSPSGSLIVFCCRVAVLYVSSSRCRGLVCDFDIFPYLLCPLVSDEPFRSSSCVLLLCGCVICLFLAVPCLGL